MSGLYTVSLRRIEVHGFGGEAPDAPENPVWRVSIRATQDVLFILGYLMTAEEDCFGQAEASIALTGRNPEALRQSEAAKADFVVWASENCFEVLYDTARRALQAQAALMDFVFADLPVYAPETEPIVDLVPPVQATKAEHEQGSSY